MNLRSTCALLAAAAALAGLAGCAQTGGAPATAQAPMQAPAQTPASPAAVERLLQAMGVEQMLGGMYEQIQQMAAGMATQAGIRPQDRPAFERYMQRVGQVMQKEAGWAQLKAPMVEIYARHYTEQEVQGLTAFYESPLGRSMVAKTPAVMRDSAAVTQDMMKRVMPRIVALAKELREETRSQPR